MTNCHGSAPRKSLDCQTVAAPKDSVTKDRVGCWRGPCYFARSGDPGGIPVRPTPRCSMRLSILLSALLATVTGFGIVTAEVAEAQAITVQISTITDREGEDYSNPWINAEECASSSATVAVSLRVLPMDKTFIDIWRGDGTRACNNTDERDPEQGTAGCTYLASINKSDDTERDETLSVGALLPCDSGDGDYRIWFLATNTEQDKTDVASYGYIQMRLDTRPPEPPMAVSGGSGDSAIPIDWDVVSDAEFYNVYVDGDGCAGSDLVANQAPPADRSPYRRHTTGNSATIDGSAVGVEYGADAAVAITALDEAKNESPLSEVVCASRVQTVGFCEDYGKCEDCSASVVGGARGFGASGLVLGLAGLILAYRRRR